MKEPGKNKLDQLFREGLSNAEDKYAYRESDWSAMEELLDEDGKKKPVGLWVRWISGIAALLFLAFGWYLVSEKNKPQQQNYAANGRVKKPATVAQNIPDQTGQQQTRAEQANAGSTKKLGLTKAGELVVSAINQSVARRGQAVAKEIKESGFNPSVVGDSLTAPLRQASEIASIEIKPDDLNMPALTNTGINDTVVQLKGSTKAIIKSKVAKDHSGAVPAFALAFTGSPDLNSASAFKDVQLGKNVSVMLTMQVNKWVFSTGAGYAVKNYGLGPGKYNAPLMPASWAQSSVAADCKVLDIPLNVSYQVFSKGRNAINLGTGLSSYFMLREHYDFGTVSNSYGTYQATYDISNKNKHILGILNLNATYQRQLNPKLGLLVQPYYKLPLTGIGNGKVDLQSAGVALGFSWNISSAKPK
ncbi:hypothetical protein MUY27_14830 [Mucilaginibacter sp. RS28]|uniref:Outer membrane protein beta-barrel domain-containing protein n=1 Tax=Mucilaginibacter straminoryzae TaxID=2932774 RepID=A0A9X2BA15_9SPHI|nr:hypothetical protein [Mucilaginibacter straminoryzae]MCJ8210991.1 hypothetical protein [Mucilaginibacter straminoryzae]